MANKKTVNYNGKKAYILRETEEFLFVSFKKDGSKQFVIKKDAEERS